MDAVAKSIEHDRPDPAERAAVFVATLNDVVQFSMLGDVQAVMSEMWALPAHLRDEFVELVWLDEEQLDKRNVTIPEGIDIQRSWFEDERPTLFCITKKLPPGYGWKVATVTIDNPMDSDSRPGWRPAGQAILP